MLQFTTTHSLASSSDVDISVWGFRAISVFCIPTVTLGTQRSA